MRNRTISLRTGVAAVAVAAVVAACGGSDDSPAAIEGTFDVGGHELYIDCLGNGRPTVVYMHGSIDEPTFDPHTSAQAVQEMLSDDHRVCLYDRRNLGHSDDVPGPQTPDDAMNDMHALLEAADVEPPYVLLGASFGGLLAYLYANEHPDDVVGMVLLDSQFPDEMTLEHLFPADDTYEALSDEDETETPERISHYKVQTAAVEYIGKEPAIPVTYFASLQEPWDEQGFGIPEYDAAILGLQADFVDRFSPGELVWVDAPHYMEPEIPDEIVAALRDVIAAAET